MSAEAFTRISDDAKRIASEMTMHSLAGMAGHWAAFKLQDGTPVEHTAFDTWIDAVKAAGWDRDTTVYLEITPDGMQPKEAEAYLKYARFLHSQGWRLPPPDGFNYPDVSALPALKSDRLLMARHLLRKDR